MINLVIDTSTDYLYIAIIQDNEVVSDYFVKGNNNHSENLIDALTKVLSEKNFLIEDFDGIYVGRGPGSYTGLRVSGTVAKVLAYSKEIPFYSFSSLDLVASAYIDVEGKYLSKIKAKKGYHYVKVLNFVNDQITEEMADSYLFDEAIEEIIKNDPTMIIIDEIKKFNPLVLFNYGLMTAVEDLHAYVPNYLRKGI